MAVIDTTNVVESSIFLKSKVKKNMVGDNYYIDSLQHKINNEWLYRYNLIDIEEENTRQNCYTKEKPNYSPIDVVIQTVITDKGIKLAEDWKKLVFRNLKHLNPLGKRFRFSLDFEKNVEYTEAEKEIESSIWLTVNKDSASPTKGIVVRRCNTNIVIGGSPTLSYDDIEEYHKEPAILEDDFKYINLYYNDRVNLPNAEIYLTMQYNYFTRGIKINDRIVIGDVDLEDKKNNSVFKVKAVEKFLSRSTFKVGTNLSESDVSLVVLALDKDVHNNTEEDFEHRLAKQSPLYKVSKDNETIPEDTNDTEVIPPNEENENLDNYSIVFEEDIPSKLLQGEEIIITCNLYNNGIKIDDIEFEVESDLLGTEKDSLYYSIEQTSTNVFVLTNNRPYLNNKLSLDFRCVAPDNEAYIRTVNLTLGGFY